MPIRTFEDCIEIIDREISKRNAKWHLHIISWMDFSDVSQILRIHIYKKWDKYDQARPLEPWISRVISSQIKNLIRNHYSSVCRPCLRCPAAEGENLCQIYVRQCNDCPLYLKWERTKKQAYNVKLPVSLEHHTQEINHKFEDGIDLDQQRQVFEDKLKVILTTTEFKFYTLHFVEQLSDQQVAIELSPNAQNESPTTRLVRFNKIRKSVLDKVKVAVESGELEPIKG